jgi:erythromycin esterase-like protein
MTDSTPVHRTLAEWIARDAIPFSLDSTDSLNSAVDRVAASLDASVELLALGEALHGSEEILLFRNRLFQRLVESHGYTAIAVESSFPCSRIVNGI